MLNCADWELWLGWLRGRKSVWWGQERDFLGEDREG